MVHSSSYTGEKCVKCHICLRTNPDESRPADAQCCDCGDFACEDHVVRVERGRFLCHSCYVANELLYKPQRRLMEKPRYRVPRQSTAH